MKAIGIVMLGMLPLGGFMYCLYSQGLKEALFKTGMILGILGALIYLVIVIYFICLEVDERKEESENPQSKEEVAEK